MDNEHFTITSSDRTEVFVYKWAPDASVPIRAAVQISHGMAEHAGRYEPFARFLGQHGYVVYANDHRGHGRTAGSKENLGHFADDNGWDLAIEDLYAITGRIKEENPERPVFFFGHSMGSFLTRIYISRYGHGIAGAIISGTGGDPGLLGAAGLLVARLEGMLRGKRARSALLDKMSFGKFNNAFKPNRTQFDWLSRDNEKVDEFIADPYCGEISTTRFFYDLFTLVRLMNEPQTYLSTPRDLPVLLLAGDKDPVGDSSKGVKHAYRAYRKAGLKQVTCQFYAGARHETLNEINREDVFNDVLCWYDAILTARQAKESPA